MHTIGGTQEEAIRQTGAESAGASPGGASRAEPDFRREIRITWLTIAATVAMAAGIAWGLGANLLDFVAVQDWAGVAGHAVFVSIIGFLLYGSFVYQFTRLGYLQRRRDLRRAGAEELADVYRSGAGELAVLVPSYKEELDVVRRTLMSAGLQDHPHRRVVLLVDDPPAPQDPADIRALAAMRKLPQSLQRLFDAAAAPFDAAQRAFLRRHATQPVDAAAETRSLARLHERAARWFKDRMAESGTDDAGERLYASLVLQRSMERHLERGAELARLAKDGGLAAERIAAEYHRLSRLFRVEFASFERKRYANLSNEPNKAMNLNSYIGLMGQRLRDVRRDDGLHLEAAPAQDDGALFVPSADFLITLDADSLIAPDYALRLIHLMSQPGNERIAVAQTPYSSIPAEPGSLEYVAGATTDIQYLIHQGFTHYGATYWVGANALLRRTALDEIVETQVERGYEVKIFIQDRTVIEDTESSVDLVDRGWQLHNYPERLAYSATPPDFGSLLIQRRRWANGGLIILPKLMRYLLRRPWGGRKSVEGFFRIHYLVSIAAVNVGLLITLAVPFEKNVEGLWWMPLSALPYFFLYARDLAQIGYRVSDLLRVYALNLLLIPINIGGVVKSIQQAISREKIPFGRTPKVLGRTAAPALYVLAEYALVVWWLAGMAVSIMEARWGHALFGLANTAFLVYAIGKYLGLRESAEDLFAALPRAAGRTAATALPAPAPVLNLEEAELRPAAQGALG